MARSKIKWREMFFRAEEEIRFERDFAMRLYKDNNNETHLHDYTIYSNLLHKLQEMREIMQNN